MSEPCKKCGSQDVKYVEFTSKAGNAVKGWKCQEKQCGDMTFAPRAKGSSPKPAQAPLGDLKTIMSMLDEILSRLPEKQRTLVQQAEEEESQESPF